MPEINLTKEQIAILKKVYDRSGIRVNWSPLSPYPSGAWADNGEWVETGELVVLNSMFTETSYEIEVVGEKVEIPNSQSPYFDRIKPTDWFSDENGLTYDYFVSTEGKRVIEGAK